MKYTLLITLYVVLGLSILAASMYTVIEAKYGQAVNCGPVTYSDNTIRNECWVVTCQEDMLCWIGD